jgi:hypothetical protein
MQKIQSYLYPNSIIVTAYLAGFSTEYKNVYQRNIKIYKGINNVIEFDIKNADQKRIDLTTLSLMRLNVMDISGNALPNSPYTVTPLSILTATGTGATVYATTGQSTTTTITLPTANVTGAFTTNSTLTVSAGIIGTVTISAVTQDIDSATTSLTVNFANQTIAGATSVSLSSTTEPLKGLASATIPAADTSGLDVQSLRYSITAVDSNSNPLLMYVDSRFGAVGTIDLAGSAVPITRPAQVLTEFTQDINYMGTVVNRSSAIPCKFYEAVPTATLNFSINVTGFQGQIYLEGTTDMTIAVNSFLNASQLYSNTISTPTTTTVTWTNVPVNDFNYFRVSWINSSVYSITPTNLNGSIGTVDKITVSH